MFEKILLCKKVRIFLAALIAGVCATSTMQAYSQQITDNISKSVLRLHVVANSDSAEDQTLKIKVRDHIINYLEPILKDIEDVENTKEIIRENLDAIHKEAEEAVKKYGYTYSVTVELGKFDFPTKKYGNAQFPKGKYDALKIVLGNGNGKNWWCVLYPQLCFTENINGVLPEESETKLKNVLTDDEYNVVTSKSKINIKFRIVEWFSF